jgi:hypothetical protein
MLDQRLVGCWNSSLKDFARFEGFAPLVLTGDKCRWLLRTADTLANGLTVLDFWHEHYTDGDLFDAAQPAGYHLMNREGLYQWGPDLPDDFVDARLTSGRLWRVLKLALKDKAHLRRMMALKESLSKPGRHWQR